MPQNIMYKNLCIEYYVQDYSAKNRNLQLRNNLFPPPNPLYFSNNKMSEILISLGGRYFFLLLCYLAILIVIF